MNDTTTRAILQPPAVVTLLCEVPLSTYTDRTEITSPDQAYEAIEPLLRGLDREAGVVVSVDTKHRILAVDTVSVGSVSHTFLAPREILRTVLTRGASAFFVAHNHPSGDPTPSRDDILVTKRLASAGEVVGIELLDHLVVGDLSFVSLARLGEL